MSEVKEINIDSKRFKMYRDLRRGGTGVRALNKYLRPGEASTFSLKYRKELTP